MVNPERISVRAPAISARVSMRYRTGSGWLRSRFLRQRAMGLAPGMTLVSYFTFGVVGVSMSTPVPYELALKTTFVKRWIFLGLTVLGLRQWLACAISKSIEVVTGQGLACSSPSSC